MRLEPAERKIIDDILGEFSDIERQLLVGRWGLHGDPCLTLQELSLTVDMSPIQCRIQLRAAERRFLKLLGRRCPTLVQKLIGKPN